MTCLCVFGVFFGDRIDPEAFRLVKHIVAKFLDCLVSQVLAMRDDKLFHNSMHVCRREQTRVFGSRAQKQYLEKLETAWPEFGLTETRLNVRWLMVCLEKLVDPDGIMTSETCRSDICLAGVAEDPTPKPIMVDLGPGKTFRIAAPVPSNRVYIPHKDEYGDCYGHLIVPEPKPEPRLVMRK